jgi:CRISPR-associated endoribonuclease Cas6
VRGKIEEGKEIHPRNLHAAFLSIFEKVNPELSRTLHESAPQKAFTISPLFKYRDGFWFRTTLLDDNLSTSFFSFFLEKPEPEVNLGNDQFKVKELKVSHNPWSGYIDYQSLLRKSTLDREITLEFRSPTCFRQGDLDLPLPLPYLVFKSYYRKWQAFSNVELELDLLDIIEKNVGISKLSGKTVPFEDGRVTIPGFVGKVTFIVKKGVDKDVLRGINLLADYAFFAGTGKETTHGMGMTRRIK